MPRRTTRAAIVLFWLAALSRGAAAQVVPSLFDVTGVAPDDRLNIRAEPAPRAAVIGTLAPDARGVEVVDRRAGWAMVNTAERAGWVDGRYLAARAGVWAPRSLPPTLSCAGNEPFWSVRQVGPRLVYETPQGGRAMERVAVLDSGAGPARSVIAIDPRGRMTAVIQPARCSDGMSERVYGLAATLVFDDAAGRAMQTGCCRIAP